MCIILSAILIYVTAVGMGLPSTAASAEETINQIPEEAWVTLEEESHLLLSFKSSQRRCTSLYGNSLIVVLVFLKECLL